MIYIVVSLMFLGVLWVHWYDTYWYDTKRFIRRNFNYLKRVWRERT